MIMALVVDDCFGSFSRRTMDLYHQHQVGTMLAAELHSLRAPIVEAAKAISSKDAADLSKLSCS